MYKSDDHARYAGPEQEQNYLIFLQLACPQMPPVPELSGTVMSCFTDREHWCCFTKHFLHLTVIQALVLLMVCPAMRPLWVQET